MGAKEAPHPVSTDENPTRLSPEWHDRLDPGQLTELRVPS
jgi:hypothetical protein